MVKVFDAPVQPNANGVTVMVATCGTLVTLLVIKLSILPLPEAARPMLVLLFVQLYTVPATAPVNTTVVVGEPWHMWLVNTACEEKRFVMLATELLDTIVDNVIILEVFVVGIDGSKGDSANSATLALRWNRVGSALSALAVGRWTSAKMVVIPIRFFMPSKTFMINLASACDVVSARFEVHVERCNLPRLLVAPIDAVVVDTGRRTSHAGHKSRARGIANR